MKHETTTLWLAGWWFQIFFLFIAKIGEKISNLTSIVFKGVGWNHQSDNFVKGRIMFVFFYHMVPGWENEVANFLVDSPPPFSGRGKKNTTKKSCQRTLERKVATKKGVANSFSSKEAGEQWIVATSYHSHWLVQSKKPFWWFITFLFTSHSIIQVGILSSGFLLNPISMGSWPHFLFYHTSVATTDFCSLSILSKWWWRISKSSSQLVK